LELKRKSLSNTVKNYKFTIERISRIEPAELNEVFCKGAPDEEIKDEDAFRSFIVEQLQNQYQADVDKNFKNEAIKAILDKLNL
jgi:FKBP-type peptidyl-prolyl cis-trans isomerase (trigger factor)